MTSRSAALRPSIPRRACCRRVAQASTSRTMLTGLKIGDVRLVQKSLADSLFRQIPAGVGTSAIVLDAAEMDAVLTGGARWAVERGWGKCRPSQRFSTPKLL